jgi:hypothetical protein
LTSIVLENINDDNYWYWSEVTIISHITLMTKKGIETMGTKFGNFVRECWEWTWEHSEQQETNCKIKKPQTKES